MPVSVGAPSMNRQDEAELFPGAAGSPPPRARRRRLTAAGLLVAAFLAFAGLTPEALPNGDAAVYAQQIARGDYSQRTVHLGYFLLGSLLKPFSSAPSDRALNLLNALLGAGTVALAYLLAMALLRRQAAAVTAGLLAATNYVLVSNAVYAEIYAAQAFFLLLALLLWLKARPVAGGASLAAAALTSPATVFALPAFPLLRPSLRALLRMALATAAVLIVALVPVLEDYLFGGRGLLEAATAPVDLAAALLKEGFEVAVGFSATLPLVVVGAVEVVRRRELRPFGLAVASLGGASFLFGERFGDVPVQLPTYVLLCVAGGLGLVRLEEALDTGAGLPRTGAWIGGLALGALFPLALLAAARPQVERLAALPASVPWPWAVIVGLAAGSAAALARRRGRLAAVALAAGLLLVNASLAFLLVRAQSRRLEAYRATVLAAGEVARPGHLVVGEWSRGILYEHYLYRDSYTDRWMDTEWLQGAWGEERQQAAARRWQEALAAGREVWLLSADGGLIPQLEERGYVVRPFGEIFRATREEP